MKIVEINSGCHGSTGGIMLSISEYARKAGHEVFTFSFRRTNKHIIGHEYISSNPEYLAHRLIAYMTGISGQGSKRGTKKLINRLKEIKPDILHLHNLHGWYINLPVLFDYIKKTNIHVVWTLHDCWPFTGQCAHFAMVKCNKWLDGCNNCPQCGIYPGSYIDRTELMWRRKRNWFTGVKQMTIVTPSYWLADLVKESYLSEYPVRVINNGINLDMFKPTESDFRKKYNCADKYILLGVASGWTNRKGLDVFVNLSKRLSQRFQIVLVGTDSKIDAKLPDNIISINKTDAQESLVKIYSAANLFVNPTREDTFPTVNMEALACGIPVVTFKTGGSPEIIDSSCGDVVECDDIDALYNLIISISQNGNMYKQACLDRAKLFCADDRYKEYLMLFEDIVV